MKQRPSLVARRENLLVVKNIRGCWAVSPAFMPNLAVDGNGRMMWYGRGAIRQRPPALRSFSTGDIPLINKNNATRPPWHPELKMRNEVWIEIEDILKRAAK